MKIDLTADYYEDSGISSLLDELYEDLPGFFLNKNYGSSDVEIFMVIICDPKKLKLRKRFDSKETVLYWDVIADYTKIKRAKKNEKRKILADAIISSFDILDRYTQLGVNKQAIKRDANGYFSSKGWISGE